MQEYCQLLPGKIWPRQSGQIHVKSNARSVQVASDATRQDLAKTVWPESCQEQRKISASCRWCYQARFGQDRLARIMPRATQDQCKLHVMLPGKIWPRQSGQNHAKSNARSVQVACDATRQDLAKTVWPESCQEQRKISASCMWCYQTRFGQDRLARIMPRATQDHCRCYQARFDQDSLARFMSRATQDHCRCYKARFDQDSLARFMSRAMQDQCKLQVMLPGKIWPRQSGQNHAKSNARSVQVACDATRQDLAKIGWPESCQEQRKISASCMWCYQARFGQDSLARIMPRVMQDHCRCYQARFDQDSLAWFMSRVMEVASYDIPGKARIMQIKRVTIMCS